MVSQKNNFIPKFLNKLQAFHFCSTVCTNTTPTVITHSYVLQKPRFCNDNNINVNVTFIKFKESLKLYLLNNTLLINYTK